MPRRDLGRIAKLKSFKRRNEGDTLRTILPTLPPHPPHPPANGYEPRKVPQSFILAGCGGCRARGGGGSGRGAARGYSIIPGKSSRPEQKLMGGGGQWGRAAKSSQRTRRPIRSPRAGDARPPPGSPGSPGPSRSGSPGLTAGGAGQGDPSSPRAGAPRIPPARN